MILLTEEQISGLAQDVIDFLSTHEETSGLTVGEWVLVLGTAAFMLGQGILIKELEEGI